MINETLRNWKNVNIFFKQTLEICSSCQDESRNVSFFKTLKNYSTYFISQNTKEKKLMRENTRLNNSFKMNGRTKGFLFLKVSSQNEVRITDK